MEIEDFYLFLFAPVILASELQKTLDDVNLRLFCLASSKNDVRSDVKVMKRAALKTRHDLSELEEEKQRQVCWSYLLVTVAY